MVRNTNIELPGLDCGQCGYRTCDEFAGRVAQQPELLRRCIHLSSDMIPGHKEPVVATLPMASSCGGCATRCEPAAGPALMGENDLAEPTWRDSLGRDIDFYLEHFPEDPGPREIIIPHNPMITRELDVQPGDVLIGRPLGMSCGCPITHCGIVMQSDHRTGVMTWCVTGPLQPRQQGYKDLGYYIAEGYEGLVRHTHCEIKIGMRYFFQPRMCMLQWRHSGLVNYLNRTGNLLQVRLEGLWIG
ncbi:MAG TPA: (Fe-S)-binding protein [Thermoguttaceae bacterium]|nr:(Fe-S)-binding protein [Thermoguttaceae bacterium]